MILISFVNQTCTKININFFNVYEYFKYLLGNLGYMGERMFVMHHIGNYKLAPRANLYVIKTFENMHVSIYILTLGFRVLNTF
jgi:hypothetical protein